jgi:uncharacterized protein YkwD
MIRSRFTVALLATAALALSIAAGASARSERSAGIERVAPLETQVLAKINAIRAGHGLRPLRLSTSLSAAATQHSGQMARLGFFSHDSAGGGSMGTRVGHYYSSRGHRSWAVGENLLWSSPTIDADRALDLWMHSSGHRANLLSRQWREIGLSAVHADTAPGVYGGSQVTIVTTDFGARS